MHLQKEKERVGETVRNTDLTAAQSIAVAYYLKSEAFFIQLLRFSASYNCLDFLLFI